MIVTNVYDGQTLVAEFQEDGSSIRLQFHSDDFRKELRIIGIIGPNNIATRTPLPTASPRTKRNFILAAQKAYTGASVEAVHCVVTRVLAEQSRFGK